MPLVRFNTRREWLLAMALFVLSCAVYLPVRNAGFIWDDVVMVTDNRCLRDLQGLKEIWFSTKTTDVYPMTFSMLWLEWHLWGPNPLGYHVVNVLLHATGALLLWRLLKRLHIPGAWFGSALFAVHPVGAASVAWISERKNTLAFVFFLLTLLAYERFQSSSQKKWYILTFVGFLAAILSKASVITLPLLFLLVVWWRNGSLNRKAILQTIPFFILSLIFGFITIWAQHHHAIGDSTPQTQNLIERLAGAGCAVLFYFWKDFMPLNLSVIYPRWQLQASDPAIYLPLLLLTGLFVVAWINRKTWGRHVLFGLGYFVIVLFPVMGFFDMYFLTFSRVADHLQHLALAGIVPFLVGSSLYFAGRWKLPQTVTFASGIVLIALLATATWIRAGVYISEEAVWTDTVRKNPRAWMAYNNLGNALFAKKSLDAGQKAYESALQENPDFPDAHSNLGNLLVAKGDLDNAIQHLRRATEVQPNNPKFHFNLGVGLAEQKKYAEALQEYAIALQLRPRYAEVKNNIAHVLLRQNKSAEALKAAEEALQINPGSAEAHFNAGEAASNLGQTAVALKHYELALQLRPTFVAAHYSAGILLAMNNDVAGAFPHFQEAVRLKPDDASLHTSLGNALAILKRPAEAIQEFQTALRLQPTNAEAHHNLGNVLSEQNRYLEAVEHYATSLKLDPQNIGTYLNFGLTLEKQGKQNEAKAQYQAALRLKPGDPAIQRQLQAVSRSN